MKKIMTDLSSSIATITLDQPEVHNAFDDQMLQELLETIQQLQQNTSIRAVVLQAKGPSFSAGADLRWMKRMKDYNLQQNLADAKILAEVMYSLYTLNKPTLAVVQGATIGGGVGLVACCDMAIASTDAYFCLSETKIGLIPAVISPYVINAIGERAARRYYLTAEKIDTPTAQRLSLIHEYTTPADLPTLRDSFLHSILQNSPAALCKAKELIQRTSRGVIDEHMIQDTLEYIAAIRTSEEGQEGLSAFLEKRRPHWQAAKG
jgi:methylglutaconyl-CoA hydratase